MNPFGNIILEGSWLAILAAALFIAALTWMRRENTIARTAVVGIALFLTWRYMAWRLFETLPPVGLTVDYITGVVFLAVEALSLLSTTLSLFFLTRIRDRTPDVEANMGWLLSHSELPLVDVLICTYNENEEILEQTIVGAMAMSYPNFRVWVGDDGRRPWLEELCKLHGCGYITRPDNAHAKAGNINNALRLLASNPRPPEFISILDADFVPAPNFLTRAMTLFRDPTVAIVQTPQHFVNPDPIQGNLSVAHAWPDEQRYFFDVLMASKDAWGAAFCCGTSSVIRFKPLMAIEGFPTDSVTEDYLVTLRLRAAGYQTVYLNEPLSLGLAPEGLKEYITQRSRWCLGFVQICRGRSGPLSMGSHLSLLDRIILSETFLYWSATHAFRILGLLIPILYLLFGIEVVHADVRDTLSHFLPYFISQMAIMIWMAEGRVLPVMADVSQLLAAHEILRAVVVGLVKPTGQKFKVTAKGGDRSQMFVQWSLLRPFLAYLGLTLAGVLSAFMLDDGRGLQEASALALFWSWYNIAILTISCIVCIEQPKMRKAERFETTEPITVDVDGVLHHHTTRDISTTGVLVRGSPPAPLGTDVFVVLDGCRMQAKIVRQTATDFGLEIEDSVVARQQMIRRIYCGRYHATIHTIRPSRVLFAVVGRVFR